MANGLSSKEIRKYVDGLGAVYGTGGDLIVKQLMLLWDSMCKNDSIDQSEETGKTSNTKDTVDDEVLGVKHFKLQKDYKMLIIEIEGQKYEAASETTKGSDNVEHQGPNGMPCGTNRECKEHRKTFTVRLDRSGQRVFDTSCTAIGRMFTRGGGGHANGIRRRTN